MYKIKSGRAGVYLPFRAPAGINIQGGSNGYFVPRFYVPRNRTGNIQYIIARRRAATEGVACLSQYFIEIYISAAVATGPSRRGPPRRFADVFWTEVFKFSLRLIMSPPLNRRDRNCDRKARERGVHYFSLSRGTFKFTWLL